MAKKQTKVPPLQRMHNWVLIGGFQVELDEHTARRIVEHPEDVAVSWREQGTLETVHGPGCSECGIHAKEGLGKPCEGAARLVEHGQPETPSTIWLPGQK